MYRQHGQAVSGNIDYAAWRNAPIPKGVSGPAETLAVEQPIRIRVDGSDAFGKWLLGYRGPSTFLGSLRDQAAAKGSLTMNQFDKAEDAWQQAIDFEESALAAFNAEVSRKVDAIAAAKGYAPVAADAPKAEPATTGKAIPNGYYTVVLDDGSHVTFRVQDGWTPEHKAKGTQIVGYLAGPDNGSDYVKFAFLDGAKLATWTRYRGKLARQEAAFKVLAGDFDAAGRAYAVKSGNCYRCNRLLTEPESIERGIGPVCIDKIGF